MMNIFLFALEHVLERNENGIEEIGSASKKATSSKRVNNSTTSSIKKRLDFVKSKKSKKSPKKNKKGAEGKLA